jgi:hypothetical protein
MKVARVLHGRGHIYYFLLCLVSVQCQNIIFVLSPRVSRSTLIHSEAHILKCIYLHYLCIIFPAHLFNKCRLLPVDPLLYRLSPEAQLPEIVFTPTVHPPLTI